MGLDGDGHAAAGDPRPRPSSSPVRRPVQELLERRRRRRARPGRRAAPERPGPRRPPRAATSSSTLAARMRAIGMHEVRVGGHGHGARSPASSMAARTARRSRRRAADPRGHPGPPRHSMPAKPIAGRPGDDLQRRPLGAGEGAEGERRGDRGRRHGDIIRHMTVAGRPRSPRMSIDIHPSFPRLVAPGTGRPMIQLTSGPGWSLPALLLRALAHARRSIPRPPHAPMPARSSCTGWT